ncbi:MAG: hypothetical protein C4542_01300 [Dehalococcoidia bacterium]|nr:MAG: hypothetical protein C4542_01300 [Dehalococcoidia bacterium]
MKPVKNIVRVRKMFDQGQPFLIDPQSGYKYSMTARCPKDSSYASVAQIEKEGQTLSRVVFQCSSCFNLFEVKQDEICVC